MKFYSIKTIPEDFNVLEVPLLPEMIEKPHATYTYLWMKKKGATTFEALDIIADFYAIPHNLIAQEGLKDETAVTEQILSIQKILNEDDIIEFNKKHATGNLSVELVRIIGYGAHPVEARKLHGNIFSIVVRNLEQQHAEQLKAFTTNNRFITFVNYYDKQRFGMDCGPFNTHLIGEAIIQGKWCMAYQELQKTKNVEETTSPASVDSTSEEACKAFFRSLHHQKIKFFVASYSSKIWNEQASAVIKGLNAGQEAPFEHVGNLYIPEKLDFQTVTSYKADGYGFDYDSFSSRKETYERDLIFKTICFSSGILPDELHARKYKITMTFFLPSGSYATMAIRQLFIKATNIYGE